jgi:hypothetical protein
MSHRQGSDAEYFADEYEMDDVEDDIEIDGESINREAVDVDSDVDEYDYSVRKMSFLMFFTFLLCYEYGVQDDVLLYNNSLSIHGAVDLSSSSLNNSSS